VKVKAFERNVKKQAINKEKAAYNAERMKIKASRSESDMNFRKLSFLTGGVLAIAFVAIVGLGVARITSSTTFGSDSVTEMTSATVSNEEVAAMISDELDGFIKQYVADLSDASGKEVELTPTEEKQIKQQMMAEIIKLLDGTDLMSLTQQEKAELISQVKESVINNVLKNSSLSQYLSDEDYITISEKIAGLADSGISSEIKKVNDTIAKNKEAQSKTDSKQDTTISSIEKDIASLNNDQSSTSKDLENKAKELENKINDATAGASESTAELEEKITKRIDESTSKIEFNSGDLDWATMKINIPVEDACLHSYSSVNVVFNGDTNFTATYTLEEGKLVFTFGKLYSPAPPTSISGTIYVNNLVTK
jgi:hypothetical protein